VTSINEALTMLKDRVAAARTAGARVDLSIVNDDVCVRVSYEMP